MAVRLLTTDAGKTLTYDLRTGTIGSDAESKLFVELAKRAKVSFSPGDLTWRDGWTDGVNADMMEVELNLDAKASFVTVFQPGSGWAAKGRRWLVVAMRPAYRKTRFLTDVPVSFTKAFALTAGGPTIAADGGKATLLAWLVPQLTDTLVGFTVASSTTSARLWFTLPERITVTYKGGEKLSQRLVQSKKATTTITIKG